MPELPEVETIRRDLAPLVVGRRIVAFHVAPGGERLLAGVPAAALRAQLVGRRLTALGRRGKYLLFHLDDGAVLIVHLRMTGALFHRQPADPPDPFLRARLLLQGGAELRFTDIRKFGTWQVVADAAETLAHLGPEPLGRAFTAEALWAALRGRTAPLKSALLNQERVAGLGNIYVDEALFEAGLHPTVPAGSLRPAERARLHAAIVRVLRQGVRRRGASFRDYADGLGRRGRQQHYVRVFRRTGQPCDVCGAPIRRTVVGGRATHWCPRCQPAAQARRKAPAGRPRRRPALSA